MSDEVEKIEAAMKGGYTITITNGEGPLPLCREGAVFQSFAALHAAMRLDQPYCPPPRAYNKLWYTFATNDGHVTYRGRFDLQQDVEPDVLEGILDHCRFVRENDHPRFKHSESHLLQATCMMLAFVTLKRHEAEIEYQAAVRAAEEQRRFVETLKAEYRTLAAEEAANTAGAVATKGGDA